MVIFSAWVEGLSLVDEDIWALVWKSSSVLKNQLLVQFRTEEVFQTRAQISSSTKTKSVDSNTEERLFTPADHNILHNVRY